MSLFKSKFFWVLLISIGTYLLFYFSVLFPDTLLSGNDPLAYFYPSRYFLHETLANGTFPFWTERIFSGYPIYADAERAFLNPVNILSVLLFGPFNSYKILHFGFYLAGSLALYGFLRRKSLGGLLSFSAANLVFYFSFFMLYHQQHFGMNLIISLLPVFLLLSDLYVETKRTRYVVLLSLLTVLCFYFGNFQALILDLFPVLFYLFFYGFPKIKHILLYSSLTLALILPQLLPTAQLYLLSSRASEQNIFGEGSFMPFSFVNVIYPYFFGVGDVYRWNIVNEEYLIHETYVYVGIVASLLSIVGFFSLKDDRFKHFCLVLLACFAFLSLGGYIPYFTRLVPPVITLFRYWGRSVVFLNIAAALLTAQFFSGIVRFDRKSVRAVLLALAGLVGFLTILQLVNLGNHNINIPFYLLRRGAFNPNADFVVWGVLILVSVAFLALLLRKLANLKLRMLLLTLMFLDAVYFGVPALTGYIKHYEDAFQTHRVFLTDSRQVGYDRSYFWNINLYTPVPSITGYSQFVLKKYSDFLTATGVSDVRKLTEKLNNEEMKDMGIGLIEAPDGLEFIGGKIIPLGSTSDVKVKDGLISFNITSQRAVEFKTHVIYYPGWEVSINGKRTRILIDDKNPFISFQLPAGKNYVVMRFIPQIFYWGLILPACLTLTTVAVFFFYGNKRISKNG